MSHGKGRGVYRGDLKDGQKHGLGLFVARRWRYEGYWENNQQHGHGIVTYLSEKTLCTEGQFDRGKKHGTFKCY